MRPSEVHTAFEHLPSSSPRHPCFGCASFRCRSPPLPCAKGAGGSPLSVRAGGHPAFVRKRGMRKWVRAPVPRFPAPPVYPRTPLPCPRAASATRSEWGANSCAQTGIGGGGCMHPCHVASLPPLSAPPIRATPPPPLSTNRACKRGITQMRNAEQRVKGTPLTLTPLPRTVFRSHVNRMCECGTAPLPLAPTHPSGKATAPLLHVTSWRMAPLTCSSARQGFTCCGCLPRDGGGRESTQRKGRAWSPQRAAAPPYVLGKGPQEQGNPEAVSLPVCARESRPCGNGNGPPAPGSCTRGMCRLGCGPHPIPRLCRGGM